MMINSALPIGFVLKGANEYTIDQPLHQGGFGITYLAKARIMVGNIPQTVTFTIKEFFLGKICSRDAQGLVQVASQHQSLFKQAKADFRSEAEVLHSLKHPHIVPVNEVFEQNNTVYYVMAYLGHVSLAQYVVEQGGFLSESQANGIITALAGAVAHLHHHHLLHLDIKPDNVMMQPMESGELRPVLIDFGQAVRFENNRLMRSKGISGYSQGYSDRRLKQPVTEFLPELDIYSLSATLYFMLTGSSPADAFAISLQKVCRMLPEGLSSNTLQALLRGMQLTADLALPNVASFLQVLQHGASADSGRMGQGGDPNGPLPTEDITDSRYSFSPVLKKILWIAAACVAIGACAYFAVCSFRSCGTSKSTTPADTTQTDTVRTDSVAQAAQHEDSIAKVATPKDAVSAKTVVDNQPQQPASEKVPSNPKKDTPQGGGASTSTTSASTSASTYGTVNLGYATWTGELLNGKPHGTGRMKFRTSHAVGGCVSVPAAGDYIDGYCERGVLLHGTLHRSNGEEEPFVR